MKCDYCQYKIDTQYHSESRMVVTDEGSVYHFCSEGCTIAYKTNMAIQKQKDRLLGTVS